MKRNARTAYNALKKIGAPVREGWGGNEHFSISAESNFCKEYNNEYWAEYYVMTDGGFQEIMDGFGVNKKITAILEKHGLYAEWYNPGVLSVYDA